MIILDATTNKLEIVLQSAITTAQLDFVASFADHTTTTLTLVTSHGQTNSVTHADLVAAPASSTQRQVKFLSIYNADTVPATVIIKYNTNSTRRVLIQATIQTGETLIYSTNNGWNTLNFSGSIKIMVACPATMADTVYKTTPLPASGSGNLSIADDTCIGNLLGTAARAYTNAKVLVEVITAIAGVTYAQAGIFRGKPDITKESVRSGQRRASLTSCGTLDISTIINATGMKTFDIPVTGISPGDQLWLLIATNATTDPAFRSDSNFTEGDITLSVDFSETGIGRLTLLDNDAVFSSSTQGNLWFALHWT
jgi:hypothetical protein